ncbi:MAG: zinc-binding dehydrogenase [Anaerolineales bacterium]|jgi:2-desacetyl-2-hydroxyethyl bacteriochlorophyllide A dehydrogenase
MKAIVNTAPNRLEFQHLPLPQPGPGQVRIRTAACGICATDILMIAGWERTSFPATPGHEWSGTVDAIGEDVDESLTGRRCVGENVLASGGEVGFEYPGGYSQYFITDSVNLYPLPDNFCMTTAALIEPLAVSLRGLKKLRLDDKSRALVIGDGPIGLLVVMLLQRVGMKEIILVGGRTPRLAIAQESGANQVLNYHQIEGDFVNGILRTSEDAFPLVVEASGSAAAMQASLKLTAACGQILVLGDYSQARADFAWNHLLHRELEMIGSNASAGAWPDAVQLAVEAVLPLERLITHRLPAQRFAEGIELTRSGRADVVKVVLEWTEGD